MNNFKLLNAKSLNVYVQQGSGGTKVGNQYTASYSISGIASGTYTMRVSKKNHVTREYTITVGGEAVTQNVKIHLKGDINGDGKVTIGDVNRANLHLKESLCFGSLIDFASTPQLLPYACIGQGPRLKKLKLSVPPHLTIWKGLVKAPFRKTMNR